MPRYYSGFLSHRHPSRMPLMQPYGAVQIYLLLLYYYYYFFSAAGGGFYADRGMHMHQYRPRPMWNQPMGGAGPYVDVELCCI